MIQHPAQHPDIHIRTADLPLTWRVTIHRNGDALDVTDSTISVRLMDDGSEIGLLDVDNETFGATGKVLVTLSTALFATMKRYSTWQLREAPYFNAIPVQGRLVKEA